VSAAESSQAAASVSTAQPNSSAPAPGTTRLSDDQAAAVLALLRKVDTVELKVTVPVEAHRATIRGLPIDPIGAKLRQVYFFDTPNLDLDRQGLVVRARRTSGGRGDTVIKLRPVEPDDLPESLRRLDEFNVEVDILPGGYVCSASFKGLSDADRVRDGVTGVLPLRKLFSREQRSFFEQHAPAGVALDGLVVLGPTFVLKSNFIADFSGRDQRVAAELWLYPDGSRILELSLRCPPMTAFHVAAEARAYLQARGVSSDENQQPKTRTALAFYAAALKRDAAPARRRRSPSVEQAAGGTVTRPA
jgi:hypothetical protein